MSKGGYKPKAGTGIPMRKFAAIRRKRRVAPKATFNRGNVIMGLGFPKKMQMNMKYLENTVITSTTGNFAAYNWSCNGLYDPNITGTGHQPMYFDQMTALYNHYCVIGSKITVNFLPNASNVGLIAVGVFVNDNAGITPTTYLGCGEQTLATTKYISYNASKPVVIQKKWAAKKYFGGSVLANTELQGDASLNPTEQSYYSVYVQSLDLASTIAVSVNVKMEFIVMWKELKDLAQS